ncbi:S-norcoclaurine synthase 1 [Linum perenne]
MARDEQPLLTDGDQLGGSIAVPNVQQLASESKDGQVPIRYIRPELELDQVSTDGSHQIPVINMAKLAGSGDAAAAEESAMLHSACKDWGFFQDEHKLSWGDMLFISTKPVSERDMRYWPRVPSSFRDSLDQYSSDLEKLVFTLLNYMAINLGLEPEKLLTLFKDGLQAVGINYYPPCKESNKVMGCTAHSDAVGLTLLTQVNDDVHGLQIRKDGEWVPIVPIPGAFIVNVGDMIEIMSNGEYKSIEHRAMVNPDKERISIATFHSPNMKAMIGPILELINEKEQAKYQSVSREEYMKLVLSSKLNGKGLISQLKIMQPATE